MKILLVSIVAVLAFIPSAMIADDIEIRANAILELSELKAQSWCLDEITPAERAVLLQEIRILQRAILSKNIEEMK